MSDEQNLMSTEICCRAFCSWEKVAWARPCWRDILRSPEWSTKVGPFNESHYQSILGEEESFEYSVFGYCRGAYTNARERGNCGVLVANVGGIV